MMPNIDWNGCGAADEKHGGGKKILIAADWVPIMDSQKTPIYDRVMSDEPEKCYGGVLDVLNPADLRVFNLECAVNGKKPVIKSGPHLLAADPLWAAAMIRNRTTTLQHVGLHLPMIERAISGKIDDVPAWSEEMEREYMIRVIK